MNWNVSTRNSNCDILHKWLHVHWWLPGALSIEAEIWALYSPRSGNALTANEMETESKITNWSSGCSRAGVCQPARSWTWVKLMISKGKMSSNIEYMAQEKQNSIFDFHNRQDIGHTQNKYHRWIGKVSSLFLIPRLYIYIYFTFQFQFQQH